MCNIGQLNVILVRILYRLITFLLSLGRCIASLGAGAVCSCLAPSPEQPANINTDMAAIIAAANNVFFISYSPYCCFVFWCCFTLVPSVLASLHLLIMSVVYNMRFSLLAAAMIAAMSVFIFMQYAQLLFGRYFVYFIKALILLYFFQPVY